MATFNRSRARLANQLLRRCCLSGSALVAALGLSFVPSNLVQPLRAALREALLPTQRTAHCQFQCGRQRAGKKLPFASTPPPPTTPNKKSPNSPTNSTTSKPNCSSSAV